MTGLPDPTPAELVAIADAKERQAKRPARAAVRYEPSGSPGVVELSPSHGSPGWNHQMRETFGTSSNAFVDGSASRIATAMQRHDEPNPASKQNGALAILGAIAPQNELEAIIGEQIIAAHMLSMRLYGLANRAEIIPQMEAYANMATKVSRTMATQVETLTKLRSGGKQQVIVKHVYVAGDALIGDHGQAVFGGVDRGGGGEILDQPHEPSVPAIPGPEVWGQDPRGLALSVTRHAPQEAVRPARRKITRSPQGGAKRSLHDRAMDGGVVGGPNPGAPVRPAGEGA